MSLFDQYWYQFGIAILFIFGIFYLYSLYQFNHWKNKKVPYLRGIFPFGTLSGLFLQKVGLVEQFLELYEKCDGKYIGFYSMFEPQILIKDVDIIKDVLVKNFNDFTNRGVYFNAHVDPLSTHLFAIEGSQWKNLRAKLSPAFTSGKMKFMYPTVKECAREFQEYGKRMMPKHDVMDFKDSTLRYGLDVISSTILGLKGNNFNEDNSDMKRIALIITSPTILQMMRLTFIMMCKTMAKILRMRIVAKEVEEYFYQIVVNNTNYREMNNLRKNDFMQLLIDLKNNKPLDEGEQRKESDNVNLTTRDMAAQSFLFVAAGFETTSVTLGFCLYELALNQSIQDRLLDEIDEVGENVTYDDLHKLSYLDMVVNETLRKYPPVANLQRECSRDYKLPGGQTVNKGTLFIISVIGLHQDPKLFPNPDVFDPERFNKENAKKVVPYSYLPFGEGPRACIGMRFGKMQVKAGLVSFLSRFRVEMCDKTAVPLKIQKRTFVYNVDGGVWLRVKER